MKKGRSDHPPFQAGRRQERPHRNGIAGMTITEVRGFGRQKGHTEMYRGTEYEVDFVPKIKIEVVVPDAKLQACWTPSSARPRPARSATARCSSPSLADVVRIRTGESGEDAI